MQELGNNDQHQDQEYYTLTYQNQVPDRQGNILLPSKLKFRSAQQMEENIPGAYQQITHQTSSIQNIKKVPISLHNKWPHSCMGLILCQYYLKKQQFYVYGTGTLIQQNLVLTSAQNVYCSRLHKEFFNIRFIIGINGNKCSQICTIKQIHYPDGYTKQSFAVLQLYNYVISAEEIEWQSTLNKIDENKELVSYGYVRNNQQGSFILQQIKIHEKVEQHGVRCSGSGIFLKQEQNKHRLIGINNRPNIKDYSLLSQGTINMIDQLNKKETIINSFTRNLDIQEIKQITLRKMPYLTTLYLIQNGINKQGCKYLGRTNWPCLKFIKLHYNNITAKGCEYLAQANWKSLKEISLNRNNIGAQGCKYLSQANWKQLTTINLDSNNIGAQGCRYLSQANWKQLTTINLANNSIRAQGCRYLSGVWQLHLITINLNQNNIGVQECKQLYQANWINLTRIQLGINRIDSQACKYLCRANWISLTTIQLYQNKIGQQGCRYLSQLPSKPSSNINLEFNEINAEGCKYLALADWSQLEYLRIQGNDLYNQNEQILLKELCRTIYPPCYN